MILSLRVPPIPFPSPPFPQSRKPKTCHLQCFSTPLNNNNNNNNNNSNKKSRRIRETPAVDLVAEVTQSIKTLVDERENAMKRSKQTLFSELCNSLNLNPDEGKRIWGKMSPDEKMVLVKGFVSDWGFRFHPLSPRSVRDMVEEYVALDSDEDELNPNSDLRNSNSGVIFSGLKNLLMGFSQSK